ncbi:hypothetical protein [Roseomonas chloroacetimidivorans]|uniref:hypothetical protein n=1 Tax=Roseomonas chloroacetimidivorans TaxID=1766656 RepID=UPI003C750191
MHLAPALKNLALLAILAFYGGSSLSKPASAASGDIYLQIMGSDTSWAAREFTGHAFSCIILHLNNGVKEDCYGFYPAGEGTRAVVSGPGVVNSEMDQNPSRFSRVTVSVERKITDSQRREILQRMSAWNSGRYNLTNSSCIDLAHDVAGVAGLRRPDRGALQLPVDYVRELDKLN